MTNFVYFIVFITMKNRVLSHFTSYAVLCNPYPYPIPSIPIQCYATPSYPIALDDAISHPSFLLVHFILSKLIILTCTTMHRPIQFYWQIPFPSLYIVLVCSHLCSLCNTVILPNISTHFHPLMLDEIVHCAVLPSG